MSVVASELIVGEEMQDRCAFNRAGVLLAHGFYCSRRCKFTITACMAKFVYAKEAVSHEKVSDVSTGCEDLRAKM